MPESRYQSSGIRKEGGRGRVTMGEGRGYATGQGNRGSGVHIAGRWTGIAIWQHLAAGIMPHAAGPGRTLALFAPDAALPAMTIPRFDCKQVIR